MLADKPWTSKRAIWRSSNVPYLAEQRGLVAYDIMTERYEVTSELQRELVNDAAVFGELETGSAAQPAFRFSVRTTS